MEAGRLLVAVGEHLRQLVGLGLDVLAAAAGEEVGGLEIEAAVSGDLVAQHLRLGGVGARLGALQPVGEAFGLGLVAVLELLDLGLQGLGLGALLCGFVAELLDVRLVEGARLFRGLRLGRLGCGLLARLGAVRLLAGRGGGRGLLGHSSLLGCDAG
jgi:hypothetical protein